MVKSCKVLNTLILPAVGGTEEFWWEYNVNRGRKRKKVAQNYKTNSGY